MRTTKNVADEPNTEKPIRRNSSVVRRRVLALTIAASGLVGVASFAVVAFAEHPEPINRLGRVGGCGWSDGYHACQSSGTRPLADLPPLSYISRYHVARFTIAGHAGQQPASGTTYYDQFDRACRSAECDAVSPVRFDAGCDAVGDQGCDAAVDPYNRGVFGLRRSQERFRPDPAAEQRRREQEELQHQRAIAAEEERQREFQVFEKYRIRDEEQETTDDEDGMPTPSLLPKPIKAPTPANSQRAKSDDEKAAKQKPQPKSESVKPDPNPAPAVKKRRDTEGNWLPQRIPPDSAVESVKKPSQPTPKSDPAADREDLLEDSPSDLPVDASSHRPAADAKIAGTETNNLAQSQFGRPRPTPTRLPPAESVRASVQKLPSDNDAPSKPLLPPVQAPVSKATDEAQTEPAKRVASADWLIIRQPK